MEIKQEIRCRNGICVEVLFDQEGYIIPTDETTQGLQREEMFF